MPTKRPNKKNTAKSNKIGLPVEHPTQEQDGDPPGPVAQTDDHETCDAILVAKTTLREEAKMKTKARASLERGLNNEALSVDYIGGIPLVGNPQGLALAGLASWVPMLESHTLPGPIDPFAGLDGQDTVEPQERAGIVLRLCGILYISYHSRSHNVNPTKIPCHVLLVRLSRVPCT